MLQFLLTVLPLFLQNPSKCYSTSEIVVCHVVVFNVHTYTTALHTRDLHLFPLENMETNATVCLHLIVLYKG